MNKVNKTNMNLTYTLHYENKTTNITGREHTFS